MFIFFKRKPIISTDADQLYSNIKSIVNQMGSNKLLKDLDLDQDSEEELTELRQKFISEANDVLKDADV